MSEQRLHAYVSGRVQGVGFRFFVIKEAAKQELTGWVRNLPDGTVEVTAEGEFEALESLLRCLWEGPPGSYVTDVRYEWSASMHAFRSFDVRGFV